MDTKINFDRAKSVNSYSTTVIMYAKYIEKEYQILT